MVATVRAPEVDDAEQLGRVHVRAWQAAYSGGLMPDEYLSALSTEERRSMWASSLRNPPGPRATRLVAAVAGEVVGFALVGPQRSDGDPEIGELYAINVDPGHWGSGVGSTLIEAAVDALRGAGFASAVLWVHPDNARARRFYESRGWVDDEVERRQEVLGVEVPEARLSLRIDEPPG